MKTIKTTLPEKSLLARKISYDYVDSFQSILNDEHSKITTSQVGKSFFSSSPKWVGKLFLLRNKIVSLFGLKTENETNNREQQLANFSCEKGEQLGLFKVIDKTENEVILGEDDKHLNFRVSFFLEKPTTQSAKRTITISTTVEFNNWFGKLYFLPVRPFHNLIVPTMLKTIINDLENNNNNEK